MPCGRRARCCKPGCVLFSDSFNREDSADLGPGWYEVPGYEGLEVKAYCPEMESPPASFGAVHAPYGGPPGFAIWKAPHPRQSPYMMGRIYLLDDHLIWGSGLVVTLALAVEYDSLTHDIGMMHVAQLRFADDGLYIDLLIRDGLCGDSTLVASDKVLGETLGDLDEERPSMICGNVYKRLFWAMVDSRAFCAGVSNAVLSGVYSNSDFSKYTSVEGTGNLKPWYMGIGFSTQNYPGTVCSASWGGTGTSTGEPSIYADNWAFWDVWDNNHACPICGCGCGDYVMPGKLLVTAHGSGCMAPIEGQTGVLEWSRLMQKWTGTITTDCATWQMSLSCPSMNEPFTIGDFLFCIAKGNCVDSDRCAGADESCRKPSPGSTCEPLDLRFGAGCPSGSGLPSCCFEYPYPCCDYHEYEVFYSDLTCNLCCPPDLGKPGEIHGTYWFEVTECADATCSEGGTGTS